MLEIAEHPLLALGWFIAEFPGPLAEHPSPEWLVAKLALDVETPFAPPDDTVKKAVRDLLRHGGFKPSGRSKPASEFLVRAATREQLSSINLPVDLCNVASLHSGVPISVVDYERLELPCSVGIAPPGSSYVFNPSGQEIRLDGLLCLADATGPCANPVKDSQRTKTHPGTSKTLCLVWGTSTLAERSAATLAWYRELHERAGATILDPPG